MVRLYDKDILIRAGLLCVVFCLLAWCLQNALPSSIAPLTPLSDIYHLALTLCLLGVFVLSWILFETRRPSNPETHKALEIAPSPQDMARKNKLKAKTRPWVGTAGQIEVGVTVGKPASCTVYFKNYGSSPARNIRVFAEIISKRQSSPPSNLMTEISQEQASIICFPSEEFYIELYSNEFPLREIDIADIYKGRRRLWVHGRIEYESDDGHHHTNFRTLYKAGCGMQPDVQGNGIS